MRMGPPTYGRSLSQPYQKPLSALERRLREAGRKEESEASQCGGGGMCLVPEFSDVSNTFEVTIKRNSLGLGFSIQGGPDAASPWTNLIRVKKVFPLQPAWETGNLKVGDIILKVSGIPLSSLTLRQALDILRTSPQVTVLQVCRTPDTAGLSLPGHSPPKSRSNVVRSYSYTPNTIMSRQTTSTSSDQDWPNNNNVPQLVTMDVEKEWSPGDEESSSTLDLLKPVEVLCGTVSAATFGEFVIDLKKVNGSLGFTLRQTDDTVLRHSVKALVKEPALSDGRIKPGDKLLSANGVDTSGFTHKELIQYLRQCPETVSLKLYRDASRSQTPLSPEASTEFLFPGRGGGGRMSSSSSPSRGKLLRYEAAEMVRSLQASRTSLEKAGLTSSSPGSYTSTGTLGRRLGRPSTPAMRDKPSSPTSPKVESPMTPQLGSAPASLGQQQDMTQSFNNLVIDDRLRIEEVEMCGEADDDMQDGGLGQVVSEPATPVTEDVGLQLVSHARSNHTNHYLIGTEGISYVYKAERPSKLNLCSEARKKKGYVFSTDKS